MMPLVASKLSLTCVANNVWLVNTAIGICVKLTGTESVVLTASAKVAQTQSTWTSMWPSYPMFGIRAVSCL